MPLCRHNLSCRNTSFLVTSFTLFFIALKISCQMIMLFSHHLEWHRESSQVLRIIFYFYGLDLSQNISVFLLLDQLWLLLFMSHIQGECACNILNYTALECDEIWPECACFSLHNTQYCMGFFLQTFPYLHATLHRISGIALQDAECSSNIFFFNYTYA